MLTIIFLMARFVLKRDGRSAAKLMIEIHEWVTTKPYFTFEKDEFLKTIDTYAPAKWGRRDE